jgi:hypothetical protein
MFGVTVVAKVRSACETRGRRIKGVAARFQERAGRRHSKKVGSGMMVNPWFRNVLYAVSLGDCHRPQYIVCQAR